MELAFGPFTLDRLLGRGGMAEVYLAHRRGDTSRAPIIIKRVRPELGQDEEQLQRMKLEATVASRISHPNLVRLIEFGRVGDCHYLVMELLRGYNLKRLLDDAMERDLPPPPMVALSIARGVLSGLAAMHFATDADGASRPIVHRDVTPGNIILTHEGRPVLIDFGIAKDVHGPNITQVGKIVGTARYMAPEARLGQLTRPSADIFSASRIFFELFTARFPWPPMSPTKELLRVVFDPPELTQEMVSRLPAEVMPLLLRGLECEAAKRFADGAEMLKAMDETRLAQREIEEPSIAFEQVRAWVASTGLPSDEELEEMVIDSASSRQLPTDAPPVEWSPQGKLAPAVTDPPAYRHSELPPAKLITIPPFAPRLEEERTADLEVAAEVVGMRRFRGWAIALLALIAVLGAAVLLGRLL